MITPRERSVKVQPFPVDFFQCHATFCSIVRDLYKKFLGMVLPLDHSSASHSRSPHQSQTDGTELSDLIRPSTIIQSAPAETSHPMSPVSTFSSSDARHGGQVSGGTVDASPDPMELKAKSGKMDTFDAFQALVAPLP